MNRVRLTEKTAADKKSPDKIRDTSGFKYDKAKAKILKDVLHNSNVALGNLIGAMRSLAMLRGSDVTPDGKLGGRGFVMDFREVKAAIIEAVSKLSDVTDTVGDELTNPQWGLKEKEINKLIKEKEDVQDKAEKVEEEVKKEDKEPEKAPKKEEPEKEPEEIQPEDVKDSSYIESVKRYKTLLDSPKDKVAGVLSKRIIANLLR
jgi:hypothetical protein